MEDALLPYKQEVTGSSPVPPTNFFNNLRTLLWSYLLLCPSSVRKIPATRRWRTPRSVMSTHRVLPRFQRELQWGRSLSTAEPRPTGSKFQMPLSGAFRDVPCRLNSKGFGNAIILSRLALSILCRLIGFQNGFQFPWYTQVPVPANRFAALRFDKHPVGQRIHFLGEQSPSNDLTG